MWQGIERGIFHCLPLTFYCLSLPFTAFPCVLTMSSGSPSPTSSADIRRLEEQEQAAAIRAEVALTGCTLLPKYRQRTMRKKLFERALSRESANPPSLRLGFGRTHLPRSQEGPGQ